MSAIVTWPEILLRLVLAFGAGAAIGWNREEGGRPAGLRTTVLVSLAAAITMVQVNLLFSLHLTEQTFRLDLMRLPLGVLSGMGFIGGGAILKRGDIVEGVTTAATLWFTTIIGLSFGAGQIALGLLGLALALVVLRGLGFVEGRIPQLRSGTLTISARQGAIGQDEVLERLKQAGFGISASRGTIANDAERQEQSYRLKWRSPQAPMSPPPVLAEFANRPGVLTVAWEPDIATLN